MVVSIFRKKFSLQGQTKGMSKITTIAKENKNMKFHHFGTRMFVIFLERLLHRTVIFGKLHWFFIRENLPNVFSLPTSNSFPWTLMWEFIKIIKMVYINFNFKISPSRISTSFRFSADAWKIASLKKSNNKIKIQTRKRTIDVNALENKQKK